MNEDQLQIARAHLDELKYGMKNIDVKSFGLRPFCRYVQRKRNKKVYSLYALKDEWIQYIESKNKSETKSDFTSFVQDITSIKISNEPTSLMSQIEYSIIHGDCILRERSITERVALIYRYYDKLKDEGMTDIDIIRADLSGMLGDYLVMTTDGKRKLRAEAQLYVLTLIYKYYNKDIDEYRKFICESYNEIRSISGHRNLVSVPVHLYKTFFHLVKSIPAEITHEEIWRRVNEIREKPELCPKFTEEKWNHELEQNRNASIEKVISLCRQRMREFESNLRHPFIIDTRTLIGLIYVIVVEDELGHYNELSEKDYLFDKIKQIDWNEISILEDKFSYFKY